MLDEFCFSQSVTEPTHERGHILDWIVFRPDDNLLSSTSVSQSLTSDHYCVVCELCVTVPPDPAVFTDTRNIRAMNRSDFRTDLRACVSPEQCPSVDEFNSAVKSVLDKHAPLRRRKVRADRLEPWYQDVSTELEAAKKEKRRAEKHWLRHPLAVNKQIFNAAKRLVASIVHKAKTAFYENKIIKAIRSPRKLFNLADKLLGRPDKRSPLPTTFPLHDLPDVFNNFFTDKIHKIRTELDQASSSAFLIKQTEQPSVSDFPAFHPVTESELKKTILKSKPTSCPLDPMPTSLLIEFLDDLLPTLTNIVNSSLLSGSFPSTFKTAVVKPLLKKSSLDQNVLKNYRPVSNLSFLSKIIERTVLEQLLAYLNQHHLLCPSQSAYRPHHSTETALLKVTNDILLALDTGNVSLLTLLDLSAAFDTIDHHILLRRLHQTYGISGAALSWFSSYLKDRTQSVIIDSHTSQPSNLSFGVPQGSVLGPVLFILYTKPLSDHIQSHSVESQSFADDTQLQTSSSPLNIHLSICSLENCISDVKVWMQQNKLKLNDDKTEALLFCSRSKTFPVSKPTSIAVCGTDISFSSSARNLGFYVTEDMSLELQIKHICRSAYCELRRISSIRHFLSVDATKMLLSAFVLSKLDYCNSLLSGCPQYLLHKLQKIQNSAARLALKAKRSDHVQPLLISLHWLPVQARIDYKLATLCHAFFCNTAPSYLSDLLSVYSPSRELRSSADTRILRIPHIKTNAFGKRSFSHAAPSVWNTLPRELRYLDSPISFKAALKTHLFKTYYL